jgi:hypothetical protein
MPLPATLNSFRHFQGIPAFAISSAISLNAHARHHAFSIPSATFKAWSNIPAFAIPSAISLNAIVRHHP